MTGVEGLTGRMGKKWITGGVCNDTHAIVRM